MALCTRRDDVEELSPLPPFHRTPLGIGQIIDGSLKLYRHHMALLLGMIFGVYLVTFIITRTIEFSSGISIGELQRLLQDAGRSGSREYFSMLKGLFVSMLPAILLMSLITYVLHTVGNGLIVQAADNIYKFGQPGTSRQVFSRLAPRLPRLVLTMMLKDILIFLPLMVPVMAAMMMLLPGIGAGGMVAVAFVIAPLFIAAISAALFLNLMFSLTPIIVISEERRFMDAIKRSWQLLRLKDVNSVPKSHMYRMAIIMSTFFVFVLLIIFIAGALPLLLNPSRLGEMMQGRVPDTGNWWSTLLIQLSTLACSALITAPMWVAYVILYFDIRLRHEGYDIQRLAMQALPAPPPEPPGLPGMAGAYAGR